MQRVFARSRLHQNPRRLRKAPGDNKDDDDDSSDDSSDDDGAGPNPMMMLMMLSLGCIQLNHSIAWCLLNRVHHIPTFAWVASVDRPV